MTGLIVFILAVVGYQALTQLTPPWIGARIGFWVSTAFTVYWSLAAVDDAMGHRWIAVAGDLFMGAWCGLGMWSFADALQRDRAEAARP